MSATLATSSSAKPALGPAAPCFDEARDDPATRGAYEALLGLLDGGRLGREAARVRRELAERRAVLGRGRPAIRGRRLA